MARGIKFAVFQNGKLGGGGRANGAKGIKSTASTLPTPSGGRSYLGAVGRGRGLTQARNVASANAARFRKGGRRSNA